jgi:hypothetical protein
MIQHNSSVVLFKSFLQAQCPTIQRIGSGHLALLRLFLDAYRKGVDDCFIPAKEMQELTRDYALIRDCVCIMKGYHNKDESVCDRIVGWTSEFIDLVINLLKEENRTLRAIRQNRHNTQTPILSVVIKHYGNSDHNNIAVYPGADSMNYTNGNGNGARLYHPDQGLSKEMRRIKFSGFVDFDIEACFPNIFRRMLKENGIYEHPMFTQMCDNKDQFLHHIINTNAFTYAMRYDYRHSTEKRAKSMRSRLFHPDSSFVLQRIGVEWYDDLGKWIAQCLRAMNVETAHMFFTTYEQAIIDKAFEVVGRDSIILRMHDGFVADINGDLTQILQQLNEITTFKWTAQLYE